MDSKLRDREEHIRSLEGEAQGKRQAQEQELLMGVSSWPIPITRGGTPDALAVPVLELPAEAEGYGNTYN